MYTEFKPKFGPDLIETIWYCDSDVDQDRGHIAPPGLGSQLVIKIYQSKTETVLSGPVTQQKQYPFVGGSHYFGVQFAPNAGPVFDDILLKDLKDASVNIDNVLGIDLTALAYQLQALDNWADQSSLIEETISKKYPEKCDFLNPNILLAIDIANKFYGNIAIKALATDVGVSKRQLERLFLKYTGVSPKTFCTTLRIQKVLAMLGRNYSAPLVNLALDCGYTDQAHLANDFRRVMGMSILRYMGSK